MKKNIGLISAFLFAAACSTSAFAAEVKVGVLNLAEVMENSKHIQALTSELKKQLDPARNKVLAEEKKFKQLQEKYNKDLAVMNDKQKAQMREKLIVEQKTLQQLDQGFLRQFQEKRTAMLKRTLDEINVVVNDIAVKDQLSLVLTNGTVLYSQKNMDITAKVLAQFDAKKSAKK